MTTTLFAALDSRDPLEPGPEHVVSTPNYSEPSTLERILVRLPEAFEVRAVLLGRGRDWPEVGQAWPATARRDHTWRTLASGVTVREDAGLRAVGRIDWPATYPTIVVAPGDAVGLLVVALRHERLVAHAAGERVERWTSGAGATWDALGRTAS